MTSSNQVICIYNACLVQARGIQGIRMLGGGAIKARLRHQKVIWVVLTVFQDPEAPLEAKDLNVAGVQKQRPTRPHLYKWVHTIVVIYNKALHMHHLSYCGCPGRSEEIPSIKKQLSGLWTGKT